MNEGIELLKNVLKLGLLMSYYLVGTFLNSMNLRRSEIKSLEVPLPQQRIIEQRVELNLVLILLIS